LIEIAVTLNTYYNARLWEAGLIQDFHQSSPFPKGAQKINREETKSTKKDRQKSSRSSFLRG
jgi:hypothetical protein